MWLNLKPYTTQLYGPKSIPYMIGISNPGNVVDQKRNTIRVRPGEETRTTPSLELLKHPKPTMDYH
jgi:hypothetical protein